MRLTDIADKNILIQVPPVEGYAPSNTAVVNYHGDIILQTRYVSYAKHYTSDIFNPLALPSNQNYIFEQSFYDSRNFRYNINGDFKEVIYPNGLDATFRGFEDPRFVVWNNDLYTYGTRADYAYECAHIVIYKEDGTEIVVNSPFGFRSEKNWMAIPDKPLHFIWGFQDNTMVICHVGDVCSITDMVSIDGFDLSNIRGGTPLLKVEDGYITIVHKQFWDGNCYYYRHAIMKFDANLRVIAMSGWFIFSNPVCEFCTGLAMSDNTIYITYSELDCVSHMLILPIYAIDVILSTDKFDDSINIDEYINISNIMYDSGHINAAKTVANFVLTYKYHPKMLNRYLDSLSIKQFLDIKYLQNITT